MPELKLIAKLLLDKSGFDRNLKDASVSTNKLSSGSLGRGFAGAAASALVALIVSAGKAAIDSGKEIDKMATSLDITAKEAQRLRLAEMLGIPSDDVKLLSYSDEELAKLRVADRIFISLKESAKVVAGKLFTGPGGTLGILSWIGRKIGISDRPPNIESNASRAAREANMAEQEEILKLEKEAAALDRQAMLAKMTEGQRFNELLKERRVLQQNLIGTDPDDIGTLMMKKRLSEVNLAIAQKGGHDLSSPFKSPLPGAFVGGFNPTANIGRDALAELRKVLKELQRGITVRDVLP